MSSFLQFYIKKLKKYKEKLKKIQKDIIGKFPIRESCKILMYF
jgi:hypothetical protein